MCKACSVCMFCGGGGVKEGGHGKREKREETKLIEKEHVQQRERSKTNSANI